MKSTIITLVGIFSFILDGYLLPAFIECIPVAWRGVLIVFTLPYWFGVSLFRADVFSLDTGRNVDVAIMVFALSFNSLCYVGIAIGVTMLIRKIRVMADSPI